MTRSALIVALLLTVFHAVAAQIKAPTLAASDVKQFQQIYHNSAVRPLNEQVLGSNLTDIGGGVWWERTFVKNNTRHVTFHFDEIKSAPGIEFRVEIWLDPQGKRLATYPAAEFASVSTFTTDLLPQGNLRLRLVSSTKPEGVSFRWAHAAWQEQPNVPQMEHLAVPRWEEVRALKADTPDSMSALAAARSMAVLHVGPSDVNCTGVLVEEGIVATNYHCLLYSLQFQLAKGSLPAPCSDIRVEFDYIQRGTTGVVTRCISVSAVSERADIALLVVNPKAIAVEGQIRRPVTLRPQREPVPERINIVHHPVGLPAVIERDCRVRAIAESDVLHNCQTTSGSSGAPVLDEKFRLFGIHYHAAYPKDWTGEMIETYLRFNDPAFNRAKMLSGIPELGKSAP